MKTQGKELHPRKDQHRLKETDDSSVYSKRPNSWIYNTD